MERHTGDNLGSFHTLWIAKAKAIRNESFSTKTFEEVYFTPNTANFSKKLTRDKQGEFYQISLSFAMPKYRQDAEKFCLDYIDIPCIAYIQTYNGDLIQIGSQKMPLFIELNFDAGDGVQGNNFYACKGNATELLNTIGKNFVLIPPPPPPPPPTVGNGLRFDGIDDYVQIPVNSYLPEFTILLHLKNNGNITNNGVLAKYQDFMTRNFSIEIVNNVLVGGYVGNSDERISIGFIDTTSIHNVCLTYKNNNLIAYLNNTVSATKITATNPPNVSQNIILAPFMLSPFNGIIYDLKIFNKELSQAEITTLVASKGNTNPATANTVVDYRFNQNSGNILLDNAGNNGTLFNFDNTNPSPNNAWVDENGNSIN